jgi:very-long-chain enoyl-CoA reductase
MLMPLASSISKNLPPVVPGIGGAVITGLQIMATVTSYAAETNPLTVTQYSKFVQENQDDDKVRMISSMHGMILIYLPALVVSVALEKFFPRKTLACRFVMIHFKKRLLEVMFLHKYSGKVKQNLSIGIGIYYALVSALICRVAQPVTSATVATTGTGKKIRKVSILNSDTPCIRVRLAISCMMTN